MRTEDEGFEARAADPRRLDGWRSRAVSRAQQGRGVIGRDQARSRRAAEASQEATEPHAGASRQDPGLQPVEGGQDGSGRRERQPRLAREIPARGRGDQGGDRSRDRRSKVAASGVRPRDPRSPWVVRGSPDRGAGTVPARTGTNG